MSLKEPYCTIAEANVALADNDAWLALDDAAKEDGLVEARYYLDDKFFCAIDEADPPSEIKLANAWLAADAAVGSGLYSSSTDPERVKSKSIKAGSVTTSKTYFSATSFRPATKARVDIYLSGICTKIGGVVVNLVRA